MIDPEDVFQSLLVKARHPAKRKGLEIIHAVCGSREQTGATNWTRASIGAASSERGGPSGPSLRLPQSADYRTLIDAWKAKSQRGPKPSSSFNRSGDWIDRIEDHALRQVVLVMRSDLARARADLQNLRGMGGGRVEVSIAGEAIPTDPAARLAPSERRALERFRDVGVLKRRGLVLTSSGELVHEATGEILAEQGWHSGLTKLLSDKGR